jgi:ELWxxDGT repeat protein
MRIRPLLVAVAVAATQALTASALDTIEIADGLVDIKHLSRINDQLFYYAEDALFRVEPSYDGDTLDDFDIFTVTTNASGIEAWGLTDATTVTTTTSFYFATHQEWNGKGALWQSDGTVAGTVAITENVPRLTGVTHVGGGEIFFTNDDGDGNPSPAVRSTLWKTDGIDVTQVADAIPGQVRGLTAVGGNAFFTTYDGTDYRLWFSDGTEAGTADITPPSGFPEDISYWYLTDVGGTLYFPVGNEGSFFPVFEPQTDFVLWQSDGTVGNTTPVTATDGLEIPINFRVQDGQYLWFSTFSNRDMEYDGEIFRLDTATDTLEQIKGGLDTVYSSDLAITDDGSGIVYFAEYNDELDLSIIWRTDGTPEGTYVFLDNLPEVHDLTCIDGVLYYASYPFAGDDDFAAPNSASTPNALGDPPLPGTWVGALLALDQDGVETFRVTLGSVLPITPGELGQAPGTQFTKKPSTWSMFRDRQRNPDATAKKASWKIANKISAKVPADTAHAEWTKKFLLYDKKAVKGVPAALLPTISPARINSVEILAKEFGPNATALPKVFLLSPPNLDTIENISNPPVEGEVMIARGHHFGAKPPKLYVEHDPKGDGILKRKACKRVSAKITPLRFMNAAGKANASCMFLHPDDPELDPVHLGYSEVRYLYPKGIVNPTGWFILDNGIALATWQQE